MTENSNPLEAATSHFHLDAVHDITGFSTTNVENGNYFWLLTKTSITSDAPDFYGYVELLSNPIFNQARIIRDAVYRFLVVIHANLSADLYINDFRVDAEMMIKRNLNKGELISYQEIVDIRRLRFPDTEIVKTDKVIYCFKVGWKFGLFFDLTRALDVEAMEFDLGKLYRNLSFQHLYDVLMNESQFMEMIRDGWFPFVEIIGGEYKLLSDVYRNKFKFEDAINKTISNFNSARIENVTNRWWNQPIFRDKKKIIQAGINAFLQNNDDGNINCIKNILPEIEGIIRLQYFSETSKSKNVNIHELLEHLVNKVKIKAGSDSLLLPIQFLSYLKDIVFSNFDLETGKLDLSRHSSAHGVAKAETYTRAKALQAILVLDQIFFYL